MSHAIYYTSAPEGVKRGSGGFCTVGVSEGIPKALWDRLETLSAYRHHFAAASGGLNPVSFAHWMLAVGGANYHVLSRVCDSGVDHTQRTNAFAHHIVVENGEMAAGGPAWMLEQAGVLATAWDGQVGTIGRPALPKGNDFGGICRSWLAATGDAGWGGHLADLFVKTPQKPVCILFSPGQEMLSLMAEAMALLPEGMRWGVTFNTYFTSMPTSATCLWRCCLAGTPAAQLGLRYAAGGLVIDLTDRAQLGTAPDGPYANMARTGQAPAAVVKAAASAAAVVKKAKPAKGPVKGTTGAYDLVDEDEPEEREVAFGDEVVTGVNEELQEDDALATMARERASSFEPERGRKKLPDFKSADAALLRAEAEAAQGAAKRRKQVVMLFVGALAAIGVGMGLVLLSFRNSGPPETIPPAPTGGQGAVKPGPVVPNQTEPAVAETEPAQTEPTVAQTQGATEPVAPTRPPPVPVVEVHYPETVALKTALEKPVFGGVIGERVQSIVYSTGDLDPAAINGMTFEFPRTAGAAADAPAGEYTFKDAPSGTLTAASVKKQGKLAVVLSWREGSESTTELVNISLDKGKGSVDVAWKPGPFLKRPELAPVVYWIIQSATLAIDNGKGTSQRVAFKAFEPPVLDFTEATIALKLPMEFPRHAVMVGPDAKSLPAEWVPTTFFSWNEKESSQRTPEKAMQVLRFKKSPATAAIDSWFLLTFKPGLTQIESTFTQRIADNQAELGKSEQKLRAIVADIQQKNRETGIPLTDPQFQPFIKNQQDAEAVVEAYKAAGANYGEMTGFDVTIELPEGLRLTTLHFKRAVK